MPLYKNIPEYYSGGSPRMNVYPTQLSSLNLYSGPLIQHPGLDGQEVSLKLHHPVGIWAALNSAMNGQLASVGPRCGGLLSSESEPKLLWQNFRNVSTYPLPGAKSEQKTQNNFFLSLARIKATVRVPFESLTKTDARKDYRDSQREAGKLGRKMACWVFF
ncbi:hypothetical protein HAX54_017718 [Datura stramonium]|uniref:Uncharacterized protein n=1 Tax=Datura stramonium TaxID=4076 RepID=A0ABS8S0N2_DATST|nr:hypothetical protein [Datura stramonium]